MTGNTLRRSTLETLGLGTPLAALRRGRPPVLATEMVDKVFGPPGDRGSLVISGANGIVGAGKAMQLGARLEPFGVPIVALDIAGAPDGIGAKYPGLVRAFGAQQAAKIAASIVHLSYDGKSLPGRLHGLKPRFLLEAIPEILELKRAHFSMFRNAFPDLEIRSVTSGFPARQLGVGIAHPAFPHEINKIFETVEAGSSDIPQLLWSLGLVPLPVSDHWSFVLDVLFCGITLAGTRYHRASNMPYWKIDKLVRRLVGPNPFRAHDAIGAKGASFLTWSCLHHLAEEYGELFRPTPELTEHKDSGQNWYPPDHFRPLVDWQLDGDEEETFGAWILGPLLQMTSLMLHEERAHLSLMNAIGEICAQFRSGALALIRKLGAEESLRLVGRYQELHPAAAASAWYPDTFERLESPDWQQLYVNAEHDGSVGVVTLGREAYNWDVDAELNRALDWLRAAGIERLVLCGDFHLAGQLVGADTAEFFAAFEEAGAGQRISATWSQTARRLHDEFRISVGYIDGKRCLGGMLELMLHCHYLVAVSDASLGLPEVTLPVVPGMEGCHWPFRRTAADEWPRLLHFLLEGRPLRAADAEGWLIDAAAAPEEAMGLVWRIATDGDHGLPRRPLVEEPLRDLAARVPLPGETGDPDRDTARQAIYDTVVAATGASLAEALAAVQARHSAGFFAAEPCRRGVVGTAYKKTMRV